MHKNQSQSGYLKDQKTSQDKWPCNYCKEFGHWKKDCPKLKAQANIASGLESENEHDEELGFAYTSSSLNIPDDNSWYVDSGASMHMTHSKENLEEYKEIKPIQIYLGNNHIVYARGIGKLKLIFEIDGIPTPFLMEKVYFVPDLKKNLLSEI